MNKLIKLIKKKLVYRSSENIYLEITNVKEFTIFYFKINKYIYITNYAIFSPFDISFYYKMRQKKTNKTDIYYFTKLNRLWQKL